MEKQNLSAKGIKREAKGLLRNNWSRALAALCVMLFAIAMFAMLTQFIISVVATVMRFDASDKQTLPETVVELVTYSKTQEGRMGGIVTAIMSVFYIMIISPLNLGVINWYQSLALCGDLKLGQVFYYYRTNELFTDALKFEVMRLLRIGGVLAACFLPSSVCLGYSIGYLTGEEGIRGDLVFPLTIAGIALAGVGLIVGVLVIVRWFVARYLYVGGHGYGIQDCFRNSKRFMKNRIGDVVMLFVSCIPMWLSCIFVFPLFYVIPMTHTIFAAAAQDIIDENLNE